MERKYKLRTLNIANLEIVVSVYHPKSYEMELTPPPHSFVTFWYRFSLKIAAYLEIVVISVSIGGKSRIRPIVQRRAQPPNPTHFSNAQSRPSCLTNVSLVINDKRTENVNFLNTSNEIHHMNFPVAWKTIFGNEEHLET